MFKGGAFPSKVAESDGRVVKYPSLGIHPTGSGWIPGNGTGSAAGNLPSTRAGGQDDVSLNKLPQIIYIYIYIYQGGDDMARTRRHEQF